MPFYIEQGIVFDTYPILYGHHRWLIMVHTEPNPKYTKIWALEFVGRVAFTNVFRVFWGMLDGVMRSEIVHVASSSARRNLKMKIQNKFSGGYKEIDSEQALYPAVKEQLERHVMWLTLKGE